MRINLLVLIVLLLLSINKVYCFQNTDTQLIKLDSKSLGVDPTKFDVEIMELKQESNTSTIEVINRKSGSVSGPMFIAKAACQIADIRKYEYFANLSSYQDKDG